MSKQQNALQGYQASLDEVVDDVAIQLQDALVDRVQEKLTTFLLDGGLQQRLMDRMAPIHQQFRQSLNSLPDTRGQGFGKPLKSAELPGGNRDI